VNNVFLNCQVVVTFNASYGGPYSAFFYCYNFESPSQTFEGSLFMKYCFCVVFFGLSFSVSGQSTFQVYFDGPPLPAPAILVQEYYESGMWFRPVDPQESFLRLTPMGSIYPNNGTAYLRTDSNPHVPKQSLMFGMDSGFGFGLISVDLAEELTTLPNQVTITFLGYRENGDIVGQSFTTDGIIDGFGPLADFETFYFGPTFASGLTRVEVLGIGWSLDNLVVIIPEPAAGGLFALGALTFVLWQRRRRKTEA
jgi:hypothetical protein